MPVIDVHAHLTPERFKEAIRKDGTWYGLDPSTGGPEEGNFGVDIDGRIAHMDADRVDMQVLTPTVRFYQYDNDLDRTASIARECNDEIAEVVDAHPDRFAGMATVPMQDVPSAIDELNRAMRELNFKGVIISDHVNGHTYDEPEFLPFFKAAESLGAVVFFHQGSDTIVKQRLHRYKMANAVGNLTERTLVFAALVFGGVMDACPDLKPLLAHGGGYTAFGIGRLDKVAGAYEGGYPKTGLQPPFIPPETEYRLQRAPSTYLSQFYYDCCTYEEHSLRFIADRVGIDRVMLGTDYPAPMELKNPVDWVEGLTAFNPEEQDAILSANAMTLFEK